MDSPEQRRKRKRFLKTTKLSPLRHLPPIRSIFYCFCFCFFILFYLVLRRHSPAIHHAVDISRFSKLTQFDSLHVFPNFNHLHQFKIESRVSFPDHILLLLSITPNSVSAFNSAIQNRFQCVYSSNSYPDQDPNDDVINPDPNDDLITGIDALSVDEYSDDRLLVRCPLPLENFTAPVALRRRGSTIGTVEDKVLNSWENLAYEAVLDGNTAVVFVKGISHRQGKESDPTHFTCHFGLPGHDPTRYALTSPAVTAAQEVIRCMLPKSIVMHPEKARGVRVTVGFRTPRAHSQPDRVLVPSVAKISLQGSKPGLIKKHELCVCTMLWNQAGSIREWVMYHSWLGVEKWFVYDNNSDDEIKTVIEDLDREGYNVSRRVWPWIKTQEAGFSHCATRARVECEWVSFMDVDEFYYFPYNPISGFPTRGVLRNLVSNHTASSVGEIRTSCHSFGPSGLTTRPTQGVTVGYTCRLQNPERHKSIVRPDALDPTLMNVVHHFQLKNGFTFVDMAQSVVMINHYKYQVWEVFRAKFYRRVATYVADWGDNQNEGSRDRAPGLGTRAIEPVDWRLRFCEVWDTGLRDFVLANLGDVTTGVLPWDRSM